MNEFCVKIPDFIKDFIRNNDGMCLGISFNNTAPYKEGIEKKFYISDGTIACYSFNAMTIKKEAFEEGVRCWMQNQKERQNSDWLRG